MYEYAATVTSVVDGDTVDAHIDLGFYVGLQLRFRLEGINTPEMTSKDPAERVRALAAKERLKVLVLGKRVVIRTKKDRQEKYGRYLATILADGVDVVPLLIAEGLGVSYDGGAR